MRKNYNIEIKEIKQDTFEIQAESSEEAEYLAEKGYYDGEYILDNTSGSKIELSFIDIESNRYITDDRKKEIFDELINYVREHSIDEKDYYNSLKNIIGVTNDEMTALEIDVTRELIEITPLESSEIEFEDELLIEEDKINAYIPLYHINPFEKFVLKEQDGFEYNMYLDYYMEENKSIITIVEKDNNNYITYEYETSCEENKMLKTKLNEYCRTHYNQELEEFIQDEEEL